MRELTSVMNALFDRFEGGAARGERVGADRAKSFRDAAVASDSEQRFCTSGSDRRV